MLLFDVDTTHPALDSGTHISTRDLLVALGFEDIVAKYTELQPGYQYHFGNFVLRASQVTGFYLRPEFFFSGIMSTPRTFGMVDFSLPLELESYEQGVALIAYNIGRGFTPATPTPWLSQGRLWEEHLPGRRELRLFAQRPHCHVDAEWFRVAVKKLIAYGDKADDTSTLKASFAAGVLKLELPGQCLVMPATGKDWPQC